MKTMQSRFRGTCRKCHGSIAKGETIVWSKVDGAAHVACAPSAAPNGHEDYPCSDRGYEDQCASWYAQNYGNEGRW